MRFLKALPTVRRKDGALWPPPPLPQSALPLRLRVLAGVVVGGGGLELAILRDASLYLNRLDGGGATDSTSEVPSESS